MRVEYETKGLIRFQEMRILFGMILTVLRGRRINENMVWTDSQDYGADEILYTARTVLFDKTNRLMRKIIILFEVYPQLYPVVYMPRQCRYVAAVRIPRGKSFRSALHILMSETKREFSSLFMTF